MNTITRLALLCLAVVPAMLPATARTAAYDIIPVPDYISQPSGRAKSFTLRNGVAVRSRGNLDFEASRLIDMASQIAGVQLRRDDNARLPGSITLETDSTLAPESFTVDVTRKGIMVRGGDAAGVMYGTNFLLKALPPRLEKGNIEMPEAHVADGPRFPYRGAHFDVSRHFFPLDSVKKFIDLLALHNVNNFHWHLTDDQGWRVEIEEYPLLTQVGSKRPNTVIGCNTGRYDTIPVEGYYTRRQLEEAVAYAAERHINIVPEIDMPGHMVAALASYPELGCTGGPYEVWRQWGISEDVLCAANPETYRFLDTVFDRITEIFPSPMIHVGGDECPKTRWRQCPRCQKAATALAPDSLTDPYERLQNAVTEHVIKRLASKGRRAVGWDELLECGSLDSTAVIHSWRDARYAAKAARKGHDTLLSPCSNLYFDYAQAYDEEGSGAWHMGFIALQDVYEFEPMPEGLTTEQQRHIIGVQPNLWTEYIADFPRALHMELPRLAAVSELQWCAPSTPKDYDGFLQRLNALLQTYDRLGYNYCRGFLDDQE